MRHAAWRAPARARYCATEFASVMPVAGIVSRRAARSLPCQPSPPPQPKRPRCAAHSDHSRARASRRDTKIVAAAEHVILRLLDDIELLGGAAGAGHCRRGLRRAYGAALSVAASASRARFFMAIFSRSIFVRGSIRAQSRQHNATHYVRCHAQCRPRQPATPPLRARARSGGVAGCRGRHCAWQRT